MWKQGFIGYISQLWNLADIFILGSFMGWIGLRGLAFLIVQKELWDGEAHETVWIPREQWGTFAPQNLADAMFGAGMIASYLKVGEGKERPYPSPLAHPHAVHQPSPGSTPDRPGQDDHRHHVSRLPSAALFSPYFIRKWLFLYILVVFSFGCGMNQLMWYYADQERQVCYR